MEWEPLPQKMKWVEQYFPVFVPPPPHFRVKVFICTHRMEMFDLELHVPFTYVDCMHFTSCDFHKLLYTDMCGIMQSTSRLI
jgi:hypothetical protein